MLPRRSQWPLNERRILTFDLDEKLGDPHFMTQNNIDFGPLRRGQINLIDRQTYKARRSAILAEWQSLMS